MTAAQTPVRWTPNLLLEDALELFSDDELCQRHGLSLGELVSYRQLQVYRTGLASARQEIAEQGLTFKHKAKLQAERFLDDEVPRWMADTDAPVKDKTALLAKLVEWGELGPKPQAQQQGGGFVFVVNMDGRQQALSVSPMADTGRTIEHAATSAVMEPVVSLGPKPGYINADLGE